MHIWPGGAPELEGLPRRRLKCFGEMWKLLLGVCENHYLLTNSLFPSTQPPWLDQPCKKIIPRCALILTALLVSRALRDGLFQPNSWMTPLFDRKDYLCVWNHQSNKLRMFKQLSSKGTFFFCGNHTKFTSKLVYIYSLLSYTRISKPYSPMAIKTGLCAPVTALRSVLLFGQNKRSRNKAWWGILALTMWTALRCHGLLSIGTCALAPSWVMWAA